MMMTEKINFHLSKFFTPLFPIIVFPVDWDVCGNDLGLDCVFKKKSVYLFLAETLIII